MPVYAYKSFDPQGHAKADTVEAPSADQARAALRNRGVHVVQLKLVSGHGPSAPGIRGGGRVPVDQQAVAFRQLAILIRAGVSLTDALYGIKNQSKNKTLQDTLSAIHDDVVGGTAFSEAVLKHPRVFPRLAADMISIAEAGGTLDDALNRLASHMESSADIIRTIKAATTYPMVVVMISLLTLVAMVTFILPRFLVLFKQMDVQLPITTKILMSVSQSTVKYWYLWLVSIVAVVGGVRRIGATRAGKLWRDKTVLKLPVLGDLATKIVVTRAMMTLGTLLNSGVQMVSALETAGAAADNEIVRSALRQAQSDVTAGASITNSLKKSGVFPALIIQMVAAGEKSGQLPEMLGHACDYYSKDIDAQLHSLTSVIEPLMIVVLGAFVGFIALSIIVPIYSLVGGVK